MFKDNLKYLRTRKGWTQAELGKMVGKGESSISEWESGLYEPRSKAVSKLAALFGVTMEDLMEGDLTSGGPTSHQPEPYDPDVQSILTLVDRRADYKILFSKTSHLKNGQLDKIAKILEASLPDDEEG